MSHFSQKSDTSNANFELNGRNNYGIGKFYFYSSIISRTKMEIDRDIDAQLPLPGIFGERKHKSPLSRDVQLYLSEYLHRIRNLQDVHYDKREDETHGGAMKTAFTAALDIMNQWLAQDRNYEATTTVEGIQVSAPGVRDRRHRNLFNGVRVLVWIEDEAGTKYYYTIDKLKEFNLKTLQEQIAGINHLYEEYTGNEVEDMSERRGFSIPAKVGLEFFRRKNQADMLRKVPQINEIGPQDTYRDFVFPGQQQRRRHHGAFWPYISTIPCCMEKLGIFQSLDPKNYENSCFIDACINSGVLNNAEIQQLKAIIMTRKFPREMVKDIAKEIKCNFVVQYVDENKPRGRQMVQKLETKKTLKQDYGRTIEMYMYREHYFLRCNVMMTKYYVANAPELLKKYSLPIERIMLIKSEGQNGPNFSKTGDNCMTIIHAMEDFNRFRPIEQDEEALLCSVEYNRRLTDYEDLYYAEEFCCKPVENKKKKIEYDYVFYADFESDINLNPHKAYLCCVVGIQNGAICRKAFKGPWCAKNFLEWLPSKSLVYFHNLKYDASFFMNTTPGKYKIKIIERSGTILQLQFFDKTNQRNLTFRNSYSIITAPLANFGEMFNLDVEKDVCPYHIYSQENIAKRFVPIEECVNCLKEERLAVNKPWEDDVEQFISNCDRLNFAHIGSKGKVVDIMEYAEYYCSQDCVVLMKGLLSFDRDLKQLFADNNAEFMGVNNYVSVSAIGYHFAVIYGCLEGCYLLAGKPQDFLSRCVSGGRTMTANNEKIVVDKKIQDFDAVSLYPSAMKAMPGIPKGKPKVLSTEECHNKDIFKYDAFYVEINIKRIESKNKRPYRFPLVFKMKDGIKTYCNEPVEHFYIDKRGLEDLLEFYDVDYEIIRGYYFNEGFNPKICEFIQKLFDLRAKYKKEKNPLQQTIKLLLNSIYGKSILKPIKTEKKVVDPKKFEDYVVRNYNFIEEITVVNGKNIYSKEIKPINKHFNCPQFGISVLSWSKHIMNCVMCLADQIGIDVYYQDTDSMHLEEEDVPKLAAAFKEKYGRELIGSQLGQFHCDFDPIKPGVPVHSIKLIALGKKSYLDILEDAEGNQAYHIRMKGIPQPVLYRHCRACGWTMEDLYNALYLGDTIQFDLLAGSNCFRKNKSYEMYTPDVFLRTVHF